jgi:hypothetical protein
VAAAGDADYGLGVRARFRVSGGVQQPGGVVGGGNAVREAAQGGEASARAATPPGGIVRLLVPVEDRRRVEVGGGEVLDQGSGVFVQAHGEGT